VTDLQCERGACPICGPDYPAIAIARGPDFEYRTTGAQEFQFARCAQCGTLVLDPRPAETVLARLYPADYEPYRFDRLPLVVRRGRDVVQRRKAAAVARHVRPGGTIVDVGCGNGTLLRAIHGAFPGRYHLVGWDYPGPHMETLAAAGIDTIASPIEPSRVPTGVDLFVLNQVIEHVPHPDRLLKSIADALVPGGRVAIETPDTDGLDASWFRRRYWGGYHLPRHLVLFNRHNLRALVERCGLRVVESKHLASPAFWIQSFHHAASESRMPKLSSLFTLANVPLVSAFAAFDTVAARLWGTSNQRLIAVRPS